jgi:DNA-binding MarR family transcriptional regulator
MGANAVVGDDRVMASTLIRRDFREALDAIDRARLTPLDVLLLIDLAQAESTVADLAERLNRRPVDVRRAIERLVARGLLRRRSRRSVARGLVFTATRRARPFSAASGSSPRAWTRATSTGAAGGPRRRCAGEPAVRGVDLSHGEGPATGPDLPRWGDVPCGAIVDLRRLGRAGRHSRDQARRAHMTDTDPRGNTRAPACRSSRRSGAAAST